VRKQGPVEVTIYIDGVFEHHLRLKRSNRNYEIERQNNTLHIMNNQSRIAMARVGDAFPDDGAPNVKVKYHLGDHLGSSSMVIDDSGAWINREEYFPYGETSFGSFARKRYRFTGMERDEESSLTYHGARYLAPWLARWTSCDPMGPVGGTNLYAYALGNPISLRDTRGKQPEPAMTMNAEGIYELPEQVIYVQGTAPTPDNLGRAAAAGLIEVTPRAELERRARFEARQDKSDRSWMRPPPDEWSASVDPEGAYADAE